MFDYFLHSDLGHREQGDILQVTLTAAANVRLLDPANFGLYQRGERCDYYGGLIRRSPYRLAIPHHGEWHAVVDLRGLSGTTTATASVIPQSAS